MSSNVAPNKRVSDTAVNYKRSKSIFPRENAFIYKNLDMNNVPIRTSKFEKISRNMEAKTNSKIALYAIKKHLTYNIKQPNANDDCLRR